MKTFNRIVLNVPHASLEGIYDRNMSFWPSNPSFMNDVVQKWTDWYTDFVFAFKSANNLVPVRFPYSRFIVDAERLWDDPMEDIGQGIVYTQFGDFKRNVTDCKKKQLQMLWKHHQQHLVSAITPDSILLDCHSFPSEMSDVDICIGYNDDWSFPGSGIIDMLQDTFERNGYTLGINNPYSNSISPKTEFEYPSLMIEINKRVYLEDNSIRMKTNRHALKVAEVMDKVYQRLSK